MWVSVDPAGPALKSPTTVPSVGWSIGLFDSMIRYLLAVPHSQSSPGADHQLPAGRVGNVCDDWAGQQLIVLDGLREARQLRAGLRVPALHDVVVGQVLADRHAEVDEPVEGHAALEDLEAGTAQVRGDRVFEQVQDLALVDRLTARRDGVVGDQIR